MRRLAMWLFSGACVLVGIVAFVPTSAARDTADAVQDAEASMQALAAQVAAAEANGETLTAYDIQELIDRSAWPTGRVYYHAWVLPLTPDGRRWIAWAAPLAHPTTRLDGLRVWERPPRVPSFFIRSAEIYLGVQVDAGALASPEGAFKLPGRLVRTRGQFAANPAGDAIDGPKP